MVFWAGSFIGQNEGKSRFVRYLLGEKGTFSPRRAEEELKLASLGISSELIILVKG